MAYLLIFLATFFLSAGLTMLVRRLAIRWNVFDVPASERKIHKAPVPLLGGTAVFFSFAIVLSALAFFTPLVIYGFISFKHIAGILLAGLIIIIGGFLDDKYNLKPKYQIIFPILAVLAVIGAGIGIGHIRNPFGGIISFDSWQLVLFWISGIPYKLTLPADLFTFIWLIGMMYTTKLLDGLDGLVSGVTVIGSIIIFAVCLSAVVSQPNTALLALLVAASFGGFLIFNFNPAKIFLGEGGSLFAGLILGILAIISGSKVATTLLIVGIPVLDVIWIIFRRLSQGKNPFTFSDRKHLHFRLLDIGLSQKQAVIFMYFLTALFGALALFSQTFGKLIEFLVLTGVMIILAAGLVIIYKRKSKPPQIT